MELNFTNEGLVFIPEWLGNKTSDNPIEVVYKAPTMQLYHKLIKPQTIHIQEGNTWETEMTIDNMPIVKEMVTSIKNCEYKMDGKPYKITKAIELYASDTPAVYMGLADEIGNFLREKLTKKEIDLKN